MHRDPGERPFDLAHEWSHDAAYAREDEANYLAIITCLRSADPGEDGVLMLIVVAFLSRPILAMRLSRRDWRHSLWPLLTFLSWERHMREARVISSSERSRLTAVASA